MGLDSVDMVVNWEKHFGIDIPNPVAEKIATLQDAVDAVSNLLSIAQDKSELEARLFSDLQKVLLDLNLTQTLPEKNEQVKVVMGELDYAKINNIAAGLNLNIPMAPADKGKLLGFRNQVDFSYKDFTLREFVAVICACNCHALTDVKNLKDKFEVYIHLMWVFSENMGINIYEIKPHKSFANDFGID